MGKPRRRLTLLGLKRRLFSAVGRLVVVLLVFGMGSLDLVFSYLRVYLSVCSQSCGRLFTEVSIYLIFSQNCKHDFLRKKSMPAIPVSGRTAALAVLAPAPPIAQPCFATFRGSTSMVPAL